MQFTQREAISLANETSVHTELDQLVGFNKKLCRIHTMGQFSDIVEPRINQIEMVWQPQTRYDSNNVEEKSNLNKKLGII